MASGKRFDPPKIVKNPLLVSACSDFRYEDFPKPPLILPACVPRKEPDKLHGNVVHESGASVGSQPLRDSAPKDGGALGRQGEERVEGPAPILLLPKSHPSLPPQPASRPSPPESTTSPSSILSSPGPISQRDIVQVNNKPSGSNALLNPPPALSIAPLVHSHPQVSSQTVTSPTTQPLLHQTSDQKGSQQNPLICPFPVPTSAIPGSTKTPVSSQNAPQIPVQPHVSTQSLDTKPSSHNPLLKSFTILTPPILANLNSPVLSTNASVPVSLPSSHSKLPVQIPNFPAPRQNPQINLTPISSSTTSPPKSLAPFAIVTSTIPSNVRIPILTGKPSTSGSIPVLTSVPPIAPNSTTLPPPTSTHNIQFLSSSDSSQNSGAKNIHFPIISATTSAAPNFPPSIQNVPVVQPVNEPQRADHKSPPEGLNFIPFFSVPPFTQNLSNIQPELPESTQITTSTSILTHIANQDPHTSKSDSLTYPFPTMSVPATKCQPCIPGFTSASPPSETPGLLTQGGAPRPSPSSFICSPNSAFAPVASSFKSKPNENPGLTILESGNVCSKDTPDDQPFVPNLSQDVTSAQAIPLQTHDLSGPLNNKSKNLFTGENALPENQSSNSPSKPQILSESGCPTTSIPPRITPSFETHQTPPISFAEGPPSIPMFNVSSFSNINAGLSDAASANPFRSQKSRGSMHSRVHDSNILSLASKGPPSNVLFLPGPPVDNFSTSHIPPPAEPNKTLKEDNFQPHLTTEGSSDISAHPDLTTHGSNLKSEKSISSLFDQNFSTQLFSSQPHSFPSPPQVSKMESNVTEGMVEETGSINLPSNDQSESLMSKYILSSLNVFGQSSAQDHQHNNEFVASSNALPVTSDIPSVLPQSSLQNTKCDMTDSFLNASNQSLCSQVIPSISSQETDEQNGNVGTLPVEIEKISLSQIHAALANAKSCNEPRNEVNITQESELGSSSTEVKEPQEEVQKNNEEQKKHDLSDELDEIPLDENQVTLYDTSTLTQAQNVLICPDIPVGNLVLKEPNEGLPTLPSLSRKIHSYHSRLNYITPGGQTKYRDLSAVNLDSAPPEKLQAPSPIFPPKLPILSPNTLKGNIEIMHQSSFVTPNIVAENNPQPSQSPFENISHPAMLNKETPIPVSPSQENTQKNLTGNSSSPEHCEIPTNVADDNCSVPSSMASSIFEGSIIPSNASSMSILSHTEVCPAASFSSSPTTPPSSFEQLGNASNSSSPHFLESLNNSMTPIETQKIIVESTSRTVNSHDSSNTLASSPSVSEFFEATSEPDRNNAPSEPSRGELVQFSYSLFEQGLNPSRQASLDLSDNNSSALPDLPDSLLSNKELDSNSFIKKDPVKETPTFSVQNVVSSPQNINFFSQDAPPPLSSNNSLNYPEKSSFSVAQSFSVTQTTNSLLGSALSLNDSEVLSNKNAEPPQSSYPPNSSSNFFDVPQTTSATSTPPSVPLFTPSAFPTTANTPFIPQSSNYPRPHFSPQLMSSEPLSQSQISKPEGTTDSIATPLPVSSSGPVSFPLPSAPPLFLFHSMQQDSQAPPSNLLNLSHAPPSSQNASAPLKGHNSYRLGSFKRVSYAPCPEFQVAEKKPISPMATAEPHYSPDSSFPSSSTFHSLSGESGTSSPTSNHPFFQQGHHPYRPPYYHWFYKRNSDSKSVWQPFSMADSLSLEQVFTSPDLNEKSTVATDGGRYDVKLLNRKKVAVYWEEEPSEVRRCSWFVKGSLEARYIPYDENIAALLEDEYKEGIAKNEWNRRVELADGEVIILYSAHAMAHHQRASSPDVWGSPPAMQQKPRVVKRGLDEFDISEGEPNQVDHLLLVVHGIGKVCDLRFRSLVEVVDDFRSISVQLVQSHFRSGVADGKVGRVEVLPVEWHRALHTEAIDKRLSDITLPSIPKAREFTNETLLDILFYTSPVFCERIVQAVGAELNRVYSLYLSRNPGFKGSVSLGGHSLGSLILFDMLCHQKPLSPLKSSSSSSHTHFSDEEEMPDMGCLKTKARLSRRMSYLTIGTVGTGQAYIHYPQLMFHPKAFFALGSPIGMFVTVRGIESLGGDFKFPTCPSFFNIFHPNDPVAYRIEALICPEMADVPAVLIPHHKGRKRMHLELKDTMTHVTAALKQKLIDSVRSTWNSVYHLHFFSKPQESIEKEMNQVIEEELLNNEVSSGVQCLTEESGLDLKVGCLNGGRRIDYVLQEAPLETFNQYISAVRSHVVYWESQDTMLLILKELYNTMGIVPDSQVSQQILPFDITSDKEGYSEYTDSIGPPPTGGFIRK